MQIKFSAAIFKLVFQHKLLKSSFKRIFTVINKEIFNNPYFSGSNDPDDLIVAAFKAYEEEDRKVSAEKFR